MTVWRCRLFSDEGTTRRHNARAIIRTSVPEEGLIQADDLPVLYQDRPPRCDSAIVLIVVSDDPKGALLGALHPLVIEFLRLDIGAEILLSVLESHGEIGRPGRAPEEIVVVAVPFPPVHLSDGTKTGPLPFKDDHVVKRLRPEAGIPRVVEERLGLAKLEGIVECQRKGLGLFELPRLLRSNARRR